MAKAKKTFIKGFISFVLLVLISPGRGIAFASLSDSNLSSYSYTPFPVRQMHTASCMDFGNDVGFGQITLGIRAGACTLFDPGSIGFGLGLQMRRRLSKKLSFEVYSDYFKTPILNVGNRTDLRFGFNMLFYIIQRPLLNHKFTPFLIGGISYEDINIVSYSVSTFKYQNWSPWLNLGYGEQFLLTPRWSIALEGFYVVPLAIHPTSYLFTPPTKFLQELRVRDEGTFAKGGIFVIFSLNYTFGNI